MRSTNWTGALIERLRELTQYSAGQAADIMSREFDLYLTRNAIIGKRNRLGLQTDCRPSITMVRRVTDRSIANLKRSPRQLKRKPPNSFLPTLVKTPEPAPLNTGFMALTDNACRWVCDGTGDDCLAVFCGHQIAPGFSYCPYHAVKTHNVVVRQVFPVAAE